MIVKDYKKSNITVIDVEGDIDLYSASDFKHQVQEKMFCSAKVIVNLKNVEYMDSSGIGVLLYLFTSCREQQIDIVFCNLTYSVDKVIKLSQLDRFLPLSENLLSASKSLKTREVV